MTEYVAGFLMAGRYVALVRKDRPAWQAGRFNAIGGHVEPGETPSEAMRREFQEETGLDLPGWQHFATVGGDWGSVRFYRLFTDIPTLQRAERQPGESEEIVFRSVQYEPLMLPNLSWLLPLAAYTHDDYEPVVATEVRTTNGGDDD